MTERRRARLLETPFPEAWRGYLTDHVAAYAALDEAQQQRLRDLTQVFVAEKHWEGAGGFEMTDECRVVIAGTACLMLLGRDHDLFADVLSIVVYPHAVVARQPQWRTYTSRTPIDDQLPIEGLAQPGGAVVLAWDAVARGARHPHAPQPRHPRARAQDRFSRRCGRWHAAARSRGPARVARRVRAGFQRHLARAQRGEPSLLRDYATTNEAEYFACATEVFFEQPEQLAAELPEVYAQLSAFFGLDPAHAVVSR